MAEKIPTSGKAGRLNPELLHLAAALTIIAACVISFSNGLNGKFVLDDQVIILRNEHIRDLKSVPALFRMNWWGMTDVQAAGALYRPLAAASFALDVYLMGGHQPERLQQQPDLGGLDVRFIHAASIAYHAIASVLVYAVLLLFLNGAGRIRWAWIGALLFAAHPAHVEAVTGMVGRADVLAGMFFLAGLLVFLRGNRDGDRPLWSIAAAILWLAGLLSKEMAVTLPVMLVLIEWLQGKPRSPARWALMYAPFVVAFGVYFAMRSIALGDEVVSASFQALSPTEVPYGARVMTMIHALAYYWKLIVLPLQLSADYNGFPITRLWWDSPLFVGGLLVHLILAVIAARSLLVSRRTDAAWPGLLGLGLAGFYIALAPVSNILVNTGIVVAERVLYIVSFWPLLALVALAQRLESTAWAAKWPRLLPALGILLVATGAWGCRVNNQNWADERTLFAAAVRHPYCGHIGIAGLARAYMMEGDYAAALPLVEKSVRQRPNAINLDYQARCLMNLNRYREAIAPLDILVRNRVGGPPMVQRLVQCYLHEGRTREARALLEQYPDWIKPGGPLHPQWQSVSQP